MFCPPTQAGRTDHNPLLRLITPIVLICLTTFTWISPLQAGDKAASQKAACDNPVPMNATRSFFIGHSLVNFDMPYMLEQIAADAGLSAEAGTQVNNGAPIRYNWENRFRASFPGDWPPPNFAGDDLPDGNWDVLVMTEGIPLETNVTWNESGVYAGNFVDLARLHNSGTRTYIYETWHSLDESNWLNRIVSDLPLWESVMEEVNSSRGAGTMHLIPAGQALRSLVLQIEGGQIPGYNSRNQLFVDDIHMNDAGNYFIACVMYATIYGRSPVGLEYRFNNRWGQAYDAPSAALAAAMQQTAWDTVRNYEHNGLSCQGGGNLAPNGTIDSPAANRTITAGDSVSFAGSASDPDNNTPFTYLWNFDGGASNRTTQDPGNVRFDNPGTYDVTFTVTDSLGLADPSPATVRITVQAPANQAPNGTIDSPAGNRTITAGDTVSFAGSASDPDNNTPFTYRWNFDGGASNRTTQDPGNVRFDNPGTYDVTFTVTDSLGLADPSPATVRITVQAPANQAPNGTIDNPSGNRTITAGDTVSFNGSASDPDNNTPFTYRWNFGGGASNRTTQDPGNVRFDNPGTYDVTFTVTDSLGLADPTPATVRITVETPNRAPNGRIDTPSSGAVIQVGDTVTFAGSVSDPDGDTEFTYLWDFDGAVARSTLQDPGPIPFNQPGSYTITFRVWDQDGLEDPTPATTTVQVTQDNRAPDGRIDAPAGNLTITPGQSVTFAGTATDADNDSMRYLWHFDGAAAGSTLEDPGPIPFATAGVYTVTFTVTDEHDVSDPSPARVVITVTENGGAPAALIASPAKSMSVLQGSSLLFSGIVGDLPGQLTYLWDFDGAAANSTMLNPGMIPFTTPGKYDITFSVSSEGVRHFSRPVTIEVVTCNQPRIQTESIVQGLAPVELEAVLCGGNETQITWWDLTRGRIIANDVSQITLDPALTETSVIRLSVFNTITRLTFTHSITILVPEDAALVDFNGNGCNDLADLRGYAAYWDERNPEAGMDANNDGKINVLDLLHINTREEGLCR